MDLCLKHITFVILFDDAKTEMTFSVAEAVDN